MNPAAIFPMTGPRMFLIVNNAAEAGSIFEMGKSAE